MKQLVSFDFETHLSHTWYPDPVGYQGVSPLPVCMSWMVNGEEPQITVDPLVMTQLLLKWLEDDNTVLVNQTISFDFLVAIKHLKQITYDLVLTKYDKGLVRDTGVREKMLAYATGEAVTNPGKKYSLADHVLKYLKKDISADKGADAWRLRYSELYGVPLEEWPEDAVRYPLDDARHALQVFAHQQKHINYFKSNELAQTRAAMDLHIVSTNMPRVDPEKIEAFREAHMHIVEKARAPLIKAGLMRWNENRYDKYLKGDSRRAGWSMINAQLHKAIREDYRRQGVPVPMTDPSDRYKQGQVKTDAETLKGCQNRHLREYGDAAKDIKLMDGFLPGLEQAAARPDRRSTTWYNSLVRTGRTSCVKGDTPVLTLEDGWIAIDDIESNKHHVWTHRKRWRRVTATYKHPEKMMWDLTLVSGHSLVCTLNHRVLTAEKKWIEVKELIDEYFKNLVIGSEKCRGSYQALQTEGSHIDTSSNSQSVRNEGRQCPARGQRTFLCARAEAVEKCSIGKSQSRHKKPHVWRQKQRSPLLCRGLRHRLRLSESMERWQEADGPQGDHGRSSRIKRTASESPYTPHQRRQERQSFGQSSSVHTSRSPGDTRQREPCQSGNCLQEAKVSGVFRVHDITVDEDESYYAGGVFNHNSSKINIQNPPRAPGVRECFRAEDGHVLVNIDYDSQEMFCLAQTVYTLFGVRELLDALNARKDPHIMVCENITGKSYKELIELKQKGDETTLMYRALGKILNFGQAGGMGAPTSVSNMTKEERKVLDTLYPGELHVNVMRRLGKMWRERWNLQPFFNHVGNKTRGGTRPTYQCLITGRIKALNSYCQMCNMHFQPIGSDITKLALQHVVDSCYREGGKLKEYGVLPCMMIHDEVVYSGPPETLSEWVPLAQGYMERAGSEILKDCVMKTGAEVCGTHWSKKGVSVEEYSEKCGY